MKLWACLVLAMMTACASNTRSDAPLFTAINPKSCPENNITPPVECFSIEVPENRAASAQTKTIRLEVLVLRKRAGAPGASPLFILPGGPGQSATRSVGARTYFVDTFDALRDTRDVVLIAPRGTAGSNELNLTPSAENYFASLQTIVPAIWAKEGRAALESRADLAAYTTSAIVDDLEATRRALGYQAINIYGTSYGTRVAQLYGVRYKETLRTLILKAPVPPDVPIPLTYTSGSDRALRLYFQRCQQDEKCRAQYPSLESRFEDLLDRMKKEPVQVELLNPLLDQREIIQIDHGVFGFVMRSLLMNAYAAPTALMLIDQSDKGDYQLLTSLLERIRNAYVAELASGMALSVIAAEDIPLITEAAREQDRRAGFLEGVVADHLIEAAGYWITKPPPSDRYEFMSGDTPTLLVAGKYDPATPPAFAETVARRLKNARVIVFPGGAHSAANFEGVGKIMTTFVETADPHTLDLSAVEGNAAVPLVP